MGKRVTYFAVWLSLLISLGCAEKGRIDPRFLTPEKTYDLWLETGLKGDIVTSLECVTGESKKLMDLQVKRRDIFLQRLTSQSKLFKEYKISGTKFKDDRAIIVLKGPKEDTIVVPFKKETDGWKVDLIAMFNM